MSQPSLRETTQSSTPCAGLGALLTDIKSRRREFERQQFISQDIVERFREIGVYRALVAKRFGGDEMPPADFCRLIETISTADGSAGWVASFGAGAIYLSTLPVATLEQIYAQTPDRIFAGGIFPPQPATRVEGGFRFSGRWEWVSGCMGADLFGAGIAPRSGDKFELPRMAVMPKEKVRIEKNWDVVGLQGTGSHDLVVEDVTVPEDWTFLRGSKPSLTEPLYRYPTLSLATQVLAVVGLGVARGAIDEVIAMSAGRTSVTGAPKLGDRVHVQMEIAKVEAELRAARSWFYEAIDEVWQGLLAGKEPSPQQISMLRLSSTHASRVGADVARRAQMLTGMTGLYRACPISAYVNDAQTVTQHAFVGDITYMNAGAMMFGLAPSPGYL